jgi:hypothetical protein
LVSTSILVPMAIPPLPFSFQDPTARFSPGHLWAGIGLFRRRKTGFLGKERGAEGYFSHPAFEVA